MALDFDVSELTTTLEELAAIRQACTEAQENAACGGLLAAAWQEEADRLAELLAFLERPQNPAPPVPPKLAAWAIRLSVRAGQLSDFDAHLSAVALETDAAGVFPLLAASEHSGDLASALATTAIYIQALSGRQQGVGEHGG